ncbi:universal stress protein [Natronorubrum texcoconense]|uniref:Nucleotide-binding universal stress protein, UspA family n=1 Tax=Natronorubrum texcoconense TaxID=1095776 RepID=A0A1G8XJZ6_9EURY|nr:universal stress protein [Natronorubrum texcoconense]SDJ90901.1 Nucleotide-binding universal stress protein, UspA family [Natronorubrum texcoconense]
MYDRILLPTDMSPGVDRAIDHAIDAATRYDAELHVLYVVDTDAYSSYPGDEYVHEFEGLERALEQAGRDAVDEIADRTGEAAVPTETEIRHGVPHEEILAYADEADVGLTVLGSKHRSGEYRRLLGSVAERVAHMTERPVTIVKTPVAEE